MAGKGRGMTGTTPETRRWYVGVLKPGGSHKAPPRRQIPAERQDEAIVERSLIDAGFEPYLPRMRKEIHIRRARKTVARRFPLFTGYVFVARPDGGMNWPRFAACDGISAVLQMDGWPLICPPGYVERMRQAEIDGIFDDTREARIRRKQEGRNRRETSKLRFKRGQIVMAKDGPFAGFNGLVEDVTGQGLIKVAIEIFSRATPVEFEPDKLVLQVEPAA